MHLTVHRRFKNHWGLWFYQNSNDGAYCTSRL